MNIFRLIEEWFRQLLITGLVIAGFGILFQIVAGKRRLVPFLVTLTGLFIAAIPMIHLILTALYW